MIKNNQKHFNRLHVVMDAVIIVAAYLCAWTIQFKTNLFNENVGRLGTRTYLTAMGIIVAGYLILYAVCGLYKPKRMHGQWYEIMNIIRANSFGLVIFIVGLYLIHEDHFSRMMMFVFYVLNICFEFLARILLRMLLRKIRTKGYNQKHILLVGYSRAAKSYIDRIRQFPQWGYHVVGILDDHARIGAGYRGEKIIGRVAKLNEVIEANDLDEIVITLGLSEYAKLEKLVMICEKSGIHTKFIPDYNNFIQTRPYIEDVQGLPVINIRHVPLSNPWNRFVKRMGDLVLGTLALVLFSPVMLVTAILVRTTSKGPVIYRQTRVGLHNKEFQMYKFRSMVAEQNGNDEKLWTKDGDARVTKFGRFIRRTSIDELPQLINVLKGEMSLVGPRPERPYYVEIFREKIPRYMVKHQVRPGMTGWAQINGYRGNTSIRKRIECDLYYIENWDVLFDFKILFGTLLKGFINKNAY